MGFAVGGARARILVDGLEVGYATGVSASETVSQFPVEALGDAFVKEHEMVGVVVSLNADFVRMRASSLRKKGIWPKGDTDAYLAFNDAAMTWELWDKSTDTILERVEGVVPETVSWRIDRGSVMTTNASFRALRMLDDTPV
jgi:hypothetical protein